MSKSVLAKTDNNQLDSPEKLSDIQIKAIAQKITIQIKTVENKSLGTGVIVRKQDFIDVLNTNEKPRYLYSVLTAYHVIRKQLKNGEIIKIITPDGQQRAINLNSATQIETNDLAVLYFESVNQYPIAKLGSSNDLNKVFSAGFPCEKDFCQDKLEFTSGITAPKEILEGNESFQGGFSIGHDSQLYEGMSGGPILDVRGNLVGINSRKKYPSLLFENSKYRYIDGSLPSKFEEFIPYFAWGISIKEYLKFRDNNQNNLALNKEFNNTFDRLSDYEKILYLCLGLFLLIFCGFVIYRRKTNCSMSTNEKHYSKRLLPSEIERVRDKFKVAEIEIISNNKKQILSVILQCLDGQKNFVYVQVEKKLWSNRICLNGIYKLKDVQGKYRIIFDKLELKTKPVNLQFSEAQPFSELSLLQVNIPVFSLDPKELLYKDIWEIFIYEDAAQYLYDRDLIEIKIRLN